jgi:glycosyltransferase involved in cell wall biosynthesis
MRLAFDVRPLQYPGHHRGIARYTRQLLEALSSRSLDIFLLAEPHLPLPLELESQPRLPASQRRPKFRQLGWLVDQFASWNDFQVDLVHLTSPFDLSFSWPLARSLPKVVTVHDFFAISEPLPGWRTLARPIYRFLAWKLKRADHLACVSRMTAESVGSWLNPCPPMTVSPLAASQLAAPGNLPAGVPDRYLLLFPCWPRHKNVEAVVKALSKTDIPLVISGDCPEEFRRYVEGQSGSPLIWTGRVSDSQLSALYASCTGFVFPSLREGFGLPPLEAMRAGAVVAVSDLAPMNRVVTMPDLTFDPRDPQAILRVCLALWESSKTPEWRTWCRRRAAEYTWARTADLTIEAYRSTLERARRTRC